MGETDMQMSQEAFEAYHKQHEDVVACHEIFAEAMGAESMEGLTLPQAAAQLVSQRENARNAAAAYKRQLEEPMPIADALRVIQREAERWEGIARVHKYAAETAQKEVAAYKAEAEELRVALEGLVRLGEREGRPGFVYVEGNRRCEVDRARELLAKGGQR